MSKHKWIREITHFINGGEVQYRRGYYFMVQAGEWKPVHNIADFDRINIYEYRIKDSANMMRAAVYQGDNGPYIGNVDEQRSLYRDHRRLSKIVEIQYK